MAQIDEQRIHRVLAAADLSTLVADGRVLDLGGGGEGYIAQALGPSVVAIDLSERELAEAPVDCLKVVMDAADLKFLPGTFDLVTAFFTLMFVSAEKREQVFTHVHRVLKPGGYFRIWDVTIPPRGDAPQDVFAVRVSVTLPDRSESCGYGCYWEPSRQSVDYYCAMAEAAGLNVELVAADETAFNIVLRKPLL